MTDPTTDPLAVQIGDFARDFVDAPERMAAIDRLYRIVAEARKRDREDGSLGAAYLECQRLLVECHEGRGR